MNDEGATVTIKAGASSAPRSRRIFLRHFGEMVLAMFVGMGVLGGLAHLAFAASGGSLSDAPGALQVLLMGFNMTVPMVAWMSYRGHARARSMEMAASMILPTIAAAALAWTGALQTGAALGVQHAVMIPAMLGVMLWRYEHYSQAHAQRLTPVASSCDQQRGALAAPSGLRGSPAARFGERAPG